MKFNKYIEKKGATRGLKISSSYDDVINSFKSESILLKESSRIVVGYPGDDPEYAVDNSKGKIYFSIKSNKVDSIRLSYGSSD